MKKKIFVTAAVATLFVAGLALGQANIGLKAVGASVGYVKPDLIESTLGFGVLADLGKITVQADETFWEELQKSVIFVSLSHGDSGDLAWFEDSTSQLSHVASEGGELVS